MRYTLLKGAGINQSDLRMVVFQTRDTLNKSFVQNRVCHAPITNGQLTNWDIETKREFCSSFNQTLEENDFVFGWNALGYELKICSLNPYQNQIDKFVDLFKLIHISKNRMISFYKLETVRNETNQLRFITNAQLGVEVQHIPIWIQNARPDLVEDYLIRYLNQFNTLVSPWLQAEELTIGCSDRTGSVELKFQELFTEIDLYALWIKSLLALPKHCLNLNFQL